MKKFLAIATVLLCLPQCMRLESFLFVPEKAGSDENLMSQATSIPAAQIQELKTEIASANGEKINAYLLKHTASDGTPTKRQTYGVLYCHGQTGHIGRFALRAQELWKLGLNVLVFDYQGYGKSGGSPTETNVLADARAARAYLEGRTDLGLSSSKIAIYGWSLGTGICGQVAAEVSPQALILETPITNVSDVINESTQQDFSSAWFLDSKMDLVGKIDRYIGRLLVLHGTKDTTLPYKFGQKIVDSATRASTKELWTVDDANHLTVPCVEKKDTDSNKYGCIGGFSSDYTQKVATFIDAVFGL